MELHPKYVDVVIQRWQQSTGKQATLDGDGGTFEDIAHRCMDGRQLGSQFTWTYCRLCVEVPTAFQ
jgi:hypothetical protein